MKYFLVWGAVSRAIKNLRKEKLKRYSIDLHHGLSQKKTHTHTQILDKFSKENRIRITTHTHTWALNKKTRA